MEAEIFPEHATAWVAVGLGYLVKPLSTVGSALRGLAVQLK